MTISKSLESEKALRRNIGRTGIIEMNRVAAAGWAAGGVTPSIVGKVFIPVIVVTGVYRPTIFVADGSRSSSQGDAAAALQIVIVQRVLLCRGAKDRIQSDVIIHTYSSRTFWFYI